MELIKIVNAKKVYKTGVTAIQDLNLTITKGEFVFIIGSTGCGKSTLVKMLYRAEKPTSGQIYVGGVDVGKLRNGKVYKIRRKIGVVFQDYKLLSGGEQQRVAIARAIVNGPRLLICDEPTGNLDPRTSMEIMRVLEEINKLGTTIIMVTHDIDIVKEMQRRTVVLDTGRVLKDYKEGTYTE